MWAKARPLMSTTLHRPAPIQDCVTQPIDRKTEPRHAAAQLVDGQHLMVTDHYRTGVVILEELAKLLGRPDASASFAQRSAYERRFRVASLGLMASIAKHRVQLTEAGPPGFLPELYPDTEDFVLPFVEVQALHGAWLRYQEGTHLAVIGRRLQPFYGTYAPTRTSHLELLATWLSGYAGARTLAVDVGTGCGVLAFMLARAGFFRVRATDNNPNAIESVRREIARLDEAPPISLECTDLLGEDTTPVELIVFNPPWIQGEVDDLLDQALYFQDDLFERFFSQAAERLTSTGRVVLVFSNIMQLLQPELPHPILTELERGRFRLVQKLQRKVKPSPGSRRTREKVEVWELASGAFAS